MKVSRKLVLDAQKILKKAVERDRRKFHAIVDQAKAAGIPGDLRYDHVNIWTEKHEHDPPTIVLNRTTHVTWETGGQTAADSFSVSALFPIWHWDPELSYMVEEERVLSELEVEFLGLIFGRSLGDNVWRLDTENSQDALDLDHPVLDRFPIIREKIRDREDCVFSDHRFRELLKAYFSWYKENFSQP